MEGPSLHSSLYSLLILMLYYLSISSNLVLSGDALELPQYTVVQTGPDYEIRLYVESSWMSALVPGASSFEKSTKDGFHRLYQYIHGGNSNDSTFTMTAPVVTSINSSSSGSDYIVRYYLPANRGRNPPRPNPELSLQLEKWGKRCIAARKFPGFAKDDNVGQEMEALLKSLNKHLNGKAALVEDTTYSIAQFNASRHLSGRLNEVWINVSGFTAEGCPRYQGEY